MGPPVDDHRVETTPRPKAGSRLSGLGCVVLVAGLPWAALVSYVALKLWAGAASDCEVFEAGDRFAALFLYWPAFTVALWVVFDVSVLLLSRRSLVLGIGLGVALTIAIAYWFVAGTADMIRSADTLNVCPSGLPDWWPAWAPR